MLKTSLGEINITINSQKCNYNITSLSNEDKNFSVDGRYKLSVNIPANPDKTIVECKIVDFTGDNMKGGIESGELLALISFYKDNIKLSIGIEDEISNVCCEYIDYGLRVIISQHMDFQQLIFGIAWVTIKDTEKEDIYTWFAADPTLYK